MKTLIETSLEFSCVSINCKTIFSSDLEKPLYYNIKELSGKKIRVWYNYTEDLNLTAQSSWKNLTIPEGLNEIDVKNYIITELTKD